MRMHLISIRNYRITQSFAMKLVQVISISNRLLSATAISHPSPLPFTSPPPLCNLSPQFTSSGGEKIEFSGIATDSRNLFVSMKSASKEEKIDCYLKTSALIDVWKLLEVEKVSIMLYKCKTIKQLKQVHLRMLINGLKDDDNCSYLADKVMLLTPDLISFDYAYKVFTYSSSNPNLSSYNILIKCSIGKCDSIAASAYNRMRNHDNISPDRFTFGFLFKNFASSDRFKHDKSHQLKIGEPMHGHVIKLGFISDTFVMNSLLEFYFGCVYSIRRGRGAVRKVFDEIHDRDIVSWNVMISTLVNWGFNNEAVLVFDDMLLLADHRCKPDETTLIKIIYACREELLIKQGKWLDAYIKENKLVLSLPLGNALLDMFVRYDDLGNSKVVFKSMSRRCTITWQRMLDGLVSNHFCKEALLLFDTMCCFSEEGGLKPDDSIFYPVLAAFKDDESLLGDGKRLFRAIHKMVHEFGVKPSEIDYSILIRILSRAGWVEAAMMLAEGLPWKRSVMGGWGPCDMLDWGCVLYACQIHGNENLLDSWIRKIDDVNSKQDRPRFMMSTLESYIYAILGHTENDVNYAKVMVESLISKLPEQEHVDYVNKYLKDTVETRVSTEACYHRHSYVLSAHVQEACLPLEDDDVYKVLESLHDQMISIIDHPCQLAI